MTKSLYASMPESRVAQLDTSLRERAQVLYPELWDVCKAYSAISGAMNPSVDLALLKDGAVEGVVTFYLQPKQAGGVVRDRISTFVCGNPHSSEPVWSMVKDWND